MRISLLSCISYWAILTVYGQQAATIPNPKLPSVQAPSVIINLQYNFLRSPQEIQRANMLMIEQDMLNYELQKQKELQLQKDFSEAFGPEVVYSFENNLNKPGAPHYLQAFDSIRSMLEGKRVMKTRDAIYFSEAAFYEGTLKKSDFDEVFDKITYLLRLKRKQDKLPDTDIVRNMLIFQFISDTMKIRLPAEKAPFIHFPMTYDFEDYRGQADWQKMFVTKLLSTQTGQCHSLPLLYLGIAEGLGANAHLSYAPSHTYIKIPLQNGQWQNIELTCGALTTDAQILRTGFIKSEALANKVYMTPLTKKQTIAHCMVDLAQGYQKKYGYDEFYLKCVETALKYNPNNAFAKMMLANYYTELHKHVYTQYVHLHKTKKEFESDNMVNNIYAKMQSSYKDLEEIGYEDVPEEIYNEWIRSMEKEKGKQKTNILQQSIWKTK